MEHTKTNNSAEDAGATRESFRPVPNTRSDTALGKLKFYGRMLLDLQILTIFRDIRKFMPALSGEVLDVGCGQSPYKFLLDGSRTTYHGIDIVDAQKFDYSNPDITPFNGVDIPFEDNSFDAVVCTEVLEHVFHHARLVSEMHRVLKPGGAGLITVPWSARYHYISYDYFRYTPSALSKIFDNFSSVEVSPRGNDIAVIANKLIVLWARNLLPSSGANLFLIPLWIVALPLLFVCVCFAHLSMLLSFGSTADPLGYTVTVRK